MAKARSRNYYEQKDQVSLDEFLQNLIKLNLDVGKDPFSFQIMNLYGFSYPIQGLRCNVCYFSWILTKNMKNVSER